MDHDQKLACPGETLNQWTKFGSMITSWDGNVFHNAGVYEGNPSVTGGFCSKKASGAALTVIIHG